MFRLPPRADFIRSLWLGAAVGLLFAIVFGGTDYLTGLHTFRVHVHFAFEPRIPFIPEFAILYLSICAMFALAPFVLRGWRALLSFALTLSAEIVIAGVIFVVLPVELGFPTTPSGTGLIWELFHIADLVNLEYNALPSLHVAFAITIAEVYGAGSKIWVRTSLRLWAAGVSVAAVMIHAHHLLDVAAGAILAGIALRVVYSRTSNRAFLDRIQLEWICLREFSRLLRRHRRYGLIFVVMYGRCLTDWCETRVVRTGYCLLQHLDDVADGDCEVGVKPETYLDEVLEQIKTRRYSRNSIGSVLAAFVTPELRRRSVTNNDLVRDLADLIRLMLFDHERRQTGLLMAEAKLRQHHQRTFELSLALTLGASGSDLVTEDIQGLIDALAWCSPMRDLEEDLQNGLVNIPIEVLDAAGHGRADTLSYTDLVDIPAIRSWIQREFERGLAALDLFEESLPRLSGHRGAATLRLLGGAIRRYARQYARSLPR